MTDAKQTLEDLLNHSPGAAQAPGEAAPKAQPAASVPADGSRVDRAGATSAGAKAPDEDAHALDTRDAAELESDLDELVETAKQRDDYLALAQRTQADFENYRKRVAREAATAQERGTCSLAKELLPALDNLDRALAEAGTAAEGGGQDDPLLHGVRLVRSELAAALARAGIESFSPAGEPFDPEVHEAVATAAQAPDGAPSGTVVEVYQPGYRLGASILRPARVVVAA
jgi:molecular chaperone GrpE